MRGGNSQMSATVIMILLYTIISVKASGEYCHGWHDTQGSWREGFQCPERFDSDDAIICCGQCELRYCCSSSDARLDQGTCENDNQIREPGTGNGNKENKGDGAVPIYVPFLVVGAVFVCFVLLGSVVAVCCCRCLRPKQEQSPVGGAAGGAAGGESRAEAGGLLEAIPMMASAGVSCGSSSQQSSKFTSSSSSGQSSVQPPPLLRTQAGCYLSHDAGVYFNMPASFSVLSRQQATQLLHPQYIGYTIPHEAIAPSPAPFLYHSQGSYRPLQAPFLPPASTASEPKHPL
ncbi:protein shisa-2 [Anguilla anguilla]|uniref:protein shisa-2 n=1 Tax=Anguilla anguilla TaxID=7936 RepID=UPI0015AC41A6|nr:protein shisa-2 [Anguilla anguilla]